MRYLLLAVTLMMLLGGCGGGLTSATPSEKIVRTTAALGEAPLDDRFRLAQEWMIRTFTQSADPIRFADRESGSLTADGRISYPCRWFDCMTKGDWQVGFQMHVTLRPGRIETVFRHLELLSPPAADGLGGGMRGPVWSRRDIDAIRPQLLQLHDELVARLR